MNTSIHKFLKCIQGQWLLQENYYLLISKKQIQSKKKRNFLLNLYETQNQYIGKNKEQIVLYTNGKRSNDINFKSLYFKLECFHKNTKSNFCVEMVKENLLRVYKLSEYKKITYEEYIYLINQNIIISITSIKSSDKKQYLSVKVSSYIRQLSI